MIKIFHAVGEYVSHIEAIEELCSQTLVATSYLPSHLFQKDTIARYFALQSSDKKQSRQIAESLWRRGQRIHACSKSANYHEIYEWEAFECFCNRGIVHRQESAFRVTPKEVVGALRNLRKLVVGSSCYRVAFTKEVLPFVFIIKEAGGVTIDVRNNFGYQRIQGMLLDDQEIYVEFESEFHRLWSEAELRDPKAILDLIEKKIANVTDSGTQFGDSA